MERYIKEFASARIKEVKTNDLIQENIKKSIINQIEYALKYREKGIITANETIKMILEA